MTLACMATSKFAGAPE